MGKSALKDIVREIRSSFGRFFAIFGIVAIGVAFFAGIMASSTDMKYSADQYYDDYNMMDFRLVSSIGFDEDDIKAIRNTEGVDGVFATYSTDALTVVNNQDAVVRVMAVPDEDLTEDNDDYINRPRLIEGRLPENEGECVIRLETSKDMPAAIGDTITLKSGNGDDLSDTLDCDTYTVVGIIETPYYLSYDIGESEIGSGTVSYFMMVGNSEFVSDYYTDVFVTSNEATTLDTYSDAYTELTDSIKENLQTTASEQLEQRITQIKDKFSEEKSSAELQVYNQISEQVMTQLEQQYETYYPGIDVSEMMEELYETAFDKAIATYDFSALEESIEEQQNEVLEDSQDWTWYVLGRDMCISYREYESSANRMKAIATVFPFFFFFVAGLVCLTTMTRMVDEQRGLIGIYKALGYGKPAIALKYLIYALVASLAGGIVGCMVGLRLFPNVIYNAWGILYKLPPISYANHTLLSIVAIGSMTFVTCIAAYYACYHQLEEAPANLMRPKAPKVGKKFVLERIPFLWKKISFSGKVTARNIFRYKKRFFMTVFGVAGCSALLLAGYGIKDSITSLVTKQFGEIQKYDAVITMDTDAEAQQIDDLMEQLNLNENFTSTMKTASYSSKVQNDVFTADEDAVILQSSNKSATITVVSDAEEFEDYIQLRSRTNKENYELDDNGVCITEKMANDLNVKAGDMVYIQSADGQVAQVRISHVVEMYVNHYVYMTDSYYEQIFGETPTENTILGKLVSDSSEVQSSVGAEVLNVSGVKSMTFLATNLDKFDSMIQSMNSVTYVLILSAAFLAFIVSYNLANVNISERIREIATIKVLGFYDGEVSAYVFRENIVISMIGAIAGLGLGVLLHAFIMKTVEMDGIMFGYQIHAISYVWAFLLTMIFSTIINAIMFLKLKHIPMVESLKSVE